MRFPNPAAIVTTYMEIEPVTEEPDEVTEVRYGKNFYEDEPLSVQWNDGENPHGWTFKSLEQVGDEVHGVTDQAEEVVIRPVRPDDAVDMAPNAGVPQPVDVVEAHILREDTAMLAGEVDAAVAADNSVVTLVLDTGLGLYVRYSGDWQLLPETSSSLENLALYPVAPQALDIWDAADAAAQSVSIFDLPKTINNYYSDATEQEAAQEPTPAGPTVAAIDSLLDLSNARIAASGGAAWYVRKRVEALRGAPKGEDRDVILAAAEYVRARSDGVNPDPSGIIRRDIIRRARKVGLLSDPVVLAAVNWQEWLHPRGRDGKFIEVGGEVRLFEGRGDRGERRGKVKSIGQDGIKVDVIDPETKQVIGTETVQSHQIEQFDPMARLDATAPEAGLPEGGGEGGGAGIPSTADGSPISPLPEPTTADLSQALVDRAKHYEPEITEMLEGIVGSGNGQLSSGETKFKEQRVIEEKLNRWQREHGKAPLPAAQSMNDSLRYTMTFDEGSYGEGTRKALVQLMGRPEVASLDIYNAWEDERNPYNGINVEVHMANGMIFELQFHTPESTVVKDKQHPFYRQKRVEVDEARREELNRKLHEIADGLNTPHGTAEIPSGPRSRNPNPPGNVPLVGGQLDDLITDEQSTSFKHMVQRPDGTWGWTEERQALHDAIIEDFLAGKVPPGEGEQPIFSVLGGGPAAGKSTLVNSGLFPALSDPNAVLVNADEIKDRLPEYGQMLNDPDPEVRKLAAAIVHEESSYLAKRLTDAVYTGKFHMVLDGTGDSSTKAMMKKINEARAAGYRVNGYYTTVPTEDAYQRMVARGNKTGRFVPEHILRGTHKSVSQVLPEIAGEFDEIGLYDTNERGKAKQIITGVKGEEITVHDQGLYDQFLAKANE